MSQLAPVVCWKVGPELVVGRLGFSAQPIEVARRSAASVVAAITEEIEAGRAEEPELVEELLQRRLVVEVRTSARSGRARREASLAVPDPVQLPVLVVYGRLPWDLWIAEIPMFGRIFQLDDLKALPGLVEHFVLQDARDRSPEWLHRQLLIPEPTMEIIKLHPREWSNRRRPVPHDRLQAVADEVGAGRQAGAGGAPAAAWERANEVSQVESRVSHGRNVLVVGEPKVGKSAVLQEALRRAARGARAAATLEGEELPRSFWRSSAHRLVAGSRYLGDWQRNMDELLADLTRVRGVLWLEDVLALVTIGGSPEEGLAAWLSPALAEGTVSLVGEITPRALSAARGLLPGFFDHFEEVWIEELPPSAVRSVADHLAAHAASAWKVEVTPRARNLAVQVLSRHVRQERFPGKLVTFLTSACAEATRDGRDVVDEAAVIAALVRQTGMPAVLLDDRLPLDGAALRATLSARVVGQPEAIERCVRAVLTFKAGLSDPERPITTLLLAGPTGVGKTATARSLAEWCFGQGGDGSPLVRIDMSELQHPAQLDRLLGSAREPGSLVRQVRERPFCVLLLDEIEKAHPVFFDTLLSVLDEGTLTDSFGRVTDFRRCIILLTSNLGAAPASSLGFGRGQAQITSLQAIRSFFRPEFFNRLDGVVRFVPLDAAMIRQILELELAEVGRRDGFRRRGLEIVVSERLRAHLLQEGFDPTWGARLLQRAVERHVVTPVARYLLDHPTVEQTRIDLDWDEAVVVREG